MVRDEARSVGSTGASAKRLFVFRIIGIERVGRHTLHEVEVCAFPAPFAPRSEAAGSVRSRLEGKEWERMNMKEKGERSEDVYEGTSVRRKGLCEVTPVQLLDRAS